MDEVQRFFIVHIQKTAGTTLRDRFRGHFSDAGIYPNRTDNPDKRISVISVENLRERWAARRDEIRVIAGHFALRTIDLLDADFVTLTVLRPPVERTLSYLHHQRRINAADRDLTLETIYADPFRFNGLIRNHMTRMLSMTVAEILETDSILTDVPDSRDRLERAKRALAGLDLFGLQPRFEELCEEIGRRYAVELGAPVHSNATERTEAPAGLESRIADDNALDMELYEYACGLYEQRRQAVT
jgi:hypothetical protein